MGDEESAAAFVDLESTRALAEATEIPGTNGYHALEELAVEGLQNDEMVADLDYGAAQQGLFAEDFGSSLDVLKENVVKTMIFQRHLDEYKEELEERGALGLRPQLGEFAGVFLLPFYDTQGRLNVRTNEDEEVTGVDKVRPGKAIRRQIEGLFNTPIDQFEDEVAAVFAAAEEQSGVFGVNETIALQILEEYNRGTIGDLNVIFTDVVSALDATVIAGAAARLGGRGLRSLAGVAKLSGARNTAATIDTDAIIRTLRNRDNVDVADDAIDAVERSVPTALKPTTLVEDSALEISGTLNTKLREIELIADQLGEITTQGRLSADQLDELVKAKQTELANRNKDLIVEDYRTVTDPVTKLTSIESYIGKKTGGGYATEAAAKGAATRRGLDFADVVEQDGHFFIRQTDVVEELGPDGFPLVRRADNSTDVIPDQGPITAGIKSQDLLLPPDLATRSQEAQMAGVRFREQITKPLADEILRLPKKNQQHLNTVMTIGRGERKWYTIDEFAIKWRKTAGRDPSEQDFIAYAAAKQISDIDWAIHNNHMYTNLARRGAKTIDVNNARGFDFQNLRAFEMNVGPEAASKLRLFDVDDNLIRSGKDTPVDELDDLTRKLESGDYKIFRLQDGVRYEGDMVHHILVGNRSVDVKPLARQVLNYVPGGHLFRRTKWFAKQPQVGTYKDGTEFVLGPRTLATYRTEKVAQEHVEQINKALRAYREFVGGRTAGPSVQNALAKVAVRKEIAESPFESLENLERMIEKGKIDPAFDFEPLFDRGLPQYYWKSENLQGASKAFLFGDDVGDELDGTLQWMRGSGRDYYGTRTEGLLSPHEEADVVLDPISALSKGMEHATKSHAFDHYLNRSVEEWVRNAAP
jgi:hypothetical protein